MNKTLTAIILAGAIGAAGCTIGMPKDTTFINGNPVREYKIAGVKRYVPYEYDCDRQEATYRTKSGQTITTCICVKPGKTIMDGYRSCD